MMFENLNRVVMNELKKLDTAYASKEEFSPEDAKKYDCLMHGWKCHLTAEAMYEAEMQGYSEDAGNSESRGMSGRRGRNPVNGRYMSMDSRSDMSYADGYSRGYSEAMERVERGQNQSGHFPQNMPRYPMYPERYQY